MNRTTFSLIAFIFFATSAPLWAANTPPVGFIRAQGQNLVDEDGHPFFIRATGLGNWLLPEGYMWLFGKSQGDRPRRIEAMVSDLLGAERATVFWRTYRENFLSDGDVKAMAEVGFNTVRVAVNARLLLEERDGVHFMEEGFGWIDRLIALCKAHGLYVVIDLHGAPGGQTGRNIDDSAHDKPELFTDADARSKTVALWKEIARRYQNEPAVLAYDLLNEPLPGDTDHWLNPRLEPLYKEITAAIRAVDKRHLISVEGANWANDWSVFGAPFDSNLLYQFHKYWNGTDQASIQTYLDFRSRWNVPIWCGETGENENWWYRLSFKLLEENNIGWTWWPWKKMDSWNGPYNYDQPKSWIDVIQYVSDRKGLTPAQGEAILSSLLENIKIANCNYNPDSVAAVFGREEE